MACASTRSYATSYKWGYLHEAMEVDADNTAEWLFTPAIDPGTHAILLNQIAAFDPAVLHIVSQDQAVCHLPVDDARLCYPFVPTIQNSTRSSRLGSLIKAQVCNRLYPTLARLECHIEAVAKRCLRPANFASRIHD